MNAIFDLIAKPFGYLMKFCCWISPGHNYLIALIFFTIIIQVLLCLLFGIKQHKNMLKQASIAPMAAAIRKKYAGRDDQVTKQKLQEETMALYQEHGYSPLSGCLPMLVQLPIIMALYNVIVAPLQHILMLTKTEIADILNNFLNAGYLSDTAKKVLTNGATEFTAKTVGNARVAQVEVINQINLWKAEGNTEALEDLVYSATDKIENAVIPSYSAFGIDFSATPPYPNADNFKDLWPLLIGPVLIVVTMIVSQMLSKKFTYQDPTMQQQQNGCSMKVMMYTMPLFSAWISFSLPAAVGVYWIYRSIAATLEKFILTRIMPIPKFTEEDFKKAEKELASSSSKKKDKKKVGTVAYNADGTKKRSLHHIDDEEYESAPEISAVKAAESEDSESDKLAPDVDPADAPIMKDDKGNTHYKKKQ